MLDILHLLRHSGIYFLFLSSIRFSKFGACSYIYTTNIVHLLLWDIEQRISISKENSSTSFYLTFKKIDCTFLPACFWAHPILFPTLLVCHIVCCYTRRTSAMELHWSILDSSAFFSCLRALRYMTKWNVVYMSEYIRVREQNLVM